MKTTMRTLGAAAALTLSLAITGCKDSTTGPDPAPAPPVLPKAERLMFPFSDFGDPGKMDPGVLKAEADASRLNYFNARVRVAVIQVVTEFILTPPIAAFLLAINSVPSPQDDGSYIWVYTYVDGDKEGQIRLRGKGEVDHVVWELRVTNLSEGIDNELWFEGETTGDGEEGSSGSTTSRAPTSRLSRGSSGARSPATRGSCSPTSTRTSATASRTSRRATTTRSSSSTRRRA
jgi:hypothetical protein